MLSLIATVAVIPFAGGVAVAQVHLRENAPPGDRQYVAIGSSFGAGPGVGTRAPGSPVLCLQSADDYAHLLAQKRGLSLIDVTCSGATTQSILYGGQHFLPPQLNAIGPQTKLVTVTIGGNDVSFVGNLYAWSCQNARQRVSRVWRVLVCHVTPTPKVEVAFSGLEGNMRKIVAGIHRRSPDAKVVFVDYVTVLPSTGSCPSRLPLTGQELERGRAVATRLEVLTERVAHETGSGLLKASELTRKHDLCSADPWVFGLQFPANPFSYGPLAYHPNAQAMRAIAEQLDQMLPSL